MQMLELKYLNDFFGGRKTEWAHVLAGGLSVRGADPSTGSGREDVPEAGMMLNDTYL